MADTKWQSIKGYDYSLAGLYFVTIATQNRTCLNEFIIMSNHIHGIIFAGKTEKTTLGTVMQTF